VRLYAGRSLFLLLALGAIEASGSERLDPRVAPTFEAIALTIDASRNDYEGSVRIELAVHEPTRSFRFHALELSLRTLELKGAEGPVSLRHEVGAEGLVTVQTDRNLDPGAYTLTITFSANFNRQAVGLYRMEYQGEGYLFTQFEAVDARRAFPCWDEPSFKIPFQITLKVPERFLALSNTPVASQSASDGWKTLVFEKTPPMPSYLLAIASGPLESVPIPGLSVPGRVVTVKGQSHLARSAVEETPAILAALERYFGTPYPYAKLDLVAIPEYWFGAMENPGAVTYADDVLLSDPASGTLVQRRELVSVTAHELAHMWFGDLVTMRWWNDLWLNESFASWMATKIVRELHPEFKNDLEERKDLDRLMRQDARPSTRAVRRTVESPSQILEDLGLAYGKGEAVLGMVEQWIGPDTFRRGVLAYLKAHAWKNAEASDLFDALKAASGKDVTKTLSSLLEQPGLPFIEVAVQGSRKVRLSQRRFLNDSVKAPDETWTVPLRLRYGARGRTERKSVVLEGAALEVDLGGPLEWVVADDGAYGYYRWSVPREMLMRLARDSAQILEPAERIAFLGNAGALLDAGAISGADYLALLKPFAFDAEPQVAAAMLSGLGRVERPFATASAAEDFARYVRLSLGPAARRIGFERKTGEAETVSVLRPQLLLWLGDQGRDSEVRKQAAELARTYFGDPASVDADLAGAALRVAAIEGTPEFFEAVRQRFESAQAPVERGLYLAALGAFGSAGLQDQALRYSLSDRVRPNETLAIAREIGRTEAGRDKAFRWLSESWDGLAKRLPPAFLAFMPFTASGCSLERLEAAGRFFGDPAHKVDGTEANLAKLSEEVHDCAHLRAREGASAARYLHEGTQAP
jgi:alanyl aminopeptidase